MLKKLIEIVWPRLEGEPSSYSDFLGPDFSIPDENIDRSIEFGILMYEKQKERIATIESKSSIYLGFFGTVVAILTFALKDVYFRDQRDLSHDFVLLFLGCLIVYILQVMRYSINALERRSYHSFDETDFLHGDKRKIVVGIINKVKKNYDVINEKVDCMTMAHEFTKRILWLLLTATVFLVSLSIIKYVSLISIIDIVASLSLLDMTLSDFILGFVVIVLIAVYIQVRKIANAIVG